MTKHKLDNKVEDILQHYGIKGMKWGKRRAEVKSAPAENSSGGGGGGVSDEEELTDAEKMLKLIEENNIKQKNPLDALGKKLNGIGDPIKQKGKQLITALFGKGKPTYRVVDTSKDAKIGKLKKAPNPFLNKDGSVKDEFKTKKKVKEPKYAMSPANEAFLESMKKQGWKKQEYKPKGTLKERGYTFTTTGTKVNGKAVGKDNTSAMIKELKKKGLKKVK